MGRSPGISCENDLGNLMMIGTHEAKAIVLGGMQPGQSYGAIELHEDLFLAPQDEPLAYKGSRSTQLDYCTQSLEPAGVVIKASTGTLEYRLTRLGRHEGKAFAGHVLDLSLEAGDLSLRSIYGMARTNRGKPSYPPLDRLQIFRLLMESDDMQVSTMQSRLGLNASAIVNNLVWLDRDGIVEYEAVSGRDIDQNLIFGLPESFSLNGNGNGNGHIAIEGSSEMRRMVYETVERMVADGQRECSLIELGDALAEAYPDGGFDLPNRRKYAAAMMRELIETGYVTKGLVSGKRKSVVRLRQEARPIVERAVDIADGMLYGGQDFLKKGKKRLEEILDEPEVVRELITKAFANSPTANRVSPAQRSAHVVSVLEAGPASSSEIAVQVKENGLTPASTKSTLQALRASGRVVSERLPGTRELLWELKPELK